MRLFYLFIAILLVFNNTAAAGEDRVELRVELCRDMSLSHVERWTPAWLVWMQTPRVVQLCPLYTREWRLIWYVVTLKWDRIDDPMGPSAPTDPDRQGAYPTPPIDPLILLPSGSQIGVLTQPFPGGAPGISRLFATDWRGDFPQRVEIEVFGDAAFGDHPGLPLIWKPRLHRYESAKQ